jgi:hypothetical protein
MFLRDVFLLYLFFEPNHNKNIISAVYLCTFLLFRYILGSKPHTEQNKDERKKIFVYELVIIIYLLYIIVILMLIYVYADVAPIRNGERNKKPTSDIALKLREKTKWKEEKTSGAFCTIIGQKKKERKKISYVSDQHKQEWTTLAVREKKWRPFSKFNETRTVQDLIDAYIVNKICLENWENLSMKRKYFSKHFPRYL